MDQFACFAHWCVTSYTVQRVEEYWGLARECSTRIQAAARKQGLPPAPWVAPIAARVLKRIAQSPAAGRNNTIGISNLGRLDLRCEQPPFRIRGMYSLTAQHVIGPDVMLIAATVGGQLHGTFCFTVAAEAEEDERRQFVQLFSETLRNVLTRKIWHTSHQGHPTAAFAPMSTAQETPSTNR